MTAATTPIFATPSSISTGLADQDTSMSNTHKRATIIGGLVACLALVGAASAAASLSGSDSPPVPKVSEPTEGIETVAPEIGNLPSADSPSDAIAQTMAGLDIDDFSNFSLGD